MTRNDTAAALATPAPPGRDRDLRSNAFAVALLILVQYGLGMWVNLFATIPASDQGKGPSRRSVRRWRTGRRG